MPLTMNRTICYLIISLVKPDGTALGYFVFVPKVHILNVMININSRVGIARDLAVASSHSVSHIFCSLDVKE